MKSKRRAIYRVSSDGHINHQTQNKGIKGPRGTRAIKGLLRQGTLSSCPAQAPPCLPGARARHREALGKGVAGETQPRWMRAADGGRERPWVPASQMLLGYPSGNSERCNLDSIMMPGHLEAEGYGHELSGHRGLMFMPEKAVWPRLWP